MLFLSLGHILKYNMQSSPIPKGNRNYLPDKNEFQNIDIVYLWENFSHPAYFEAVQKTKSRIMVSGRSPAYKLQAENEFAEDVVANAKSSVWGSGEDFMDLKYALRSLWMHVPWIRNVIIVVNDSSRIPVWLNLSAPNILIVDGWQLVKSLGGESPNFNSHSFYLSLAFIPGISEYFIQADDDFFFGRLIPKSLFWDTEVKKPYVYHSCSVRSGAPGKTNYLSLVKQYPIWKNLTEGFGSMTGGAHMFRLWKKEIIYRIFDTYEKEVTDTLAHPFRIPEDIDLTSLYEHFAKKYFDALPRYAQCPRMSHLQRIRGVDIWHSGNKISDLKKVLASQPFTFNKNGCKVSFDECNQIMNSLYPLPSIYENKAQGSIHDTATPRSSMPKIMGHRGNGYYSPENTLLSVFEAAENGADFVELDLLLTSDHQIVIFHDEYLNVGNNCFEGPRSELVQNLSLQELQTSYGVNSERIPTLKEMLHVFKDEKLGFQLELKGKLEKGRRNGVNYDDMLANLLLETISDFPRNRIIISSFSIERLQNLKLLQSSLLGKPLEYFPTCLIYGGFSRAERKCNTSDCLNSVFLSKAVKAGADYMSFFSADFLRVGKQLHFAAIQSGVKLQVGLPGEKGTLCLHDTTDKNLHLQTNIKVIQYMKVNEIDVSFICGNHVRVSKLFSISHYS